MKFAKIYSDVDSLRKINPSLLKELINQFNDYFSSYHIIGEKNDINFDQLCNAMMSLGSADNKEAPDALLDILHSVEQMSTQDKMETLLDHLRSQNPNYFNEIKEYSPRDVALYCRLHYPELFDRQYALSQLAKKRSFEYFLGKESINQSKGLFFEMEDRLRQEIKKWCKEHNRPSFVNCIIIQRTEKIIWIMVVHGEPLRREAKVSDSEEVNSIYYHPRTTDLLIYDSEKNRLQLKCDSKKLTTHYYRLLGEFCFNDPEFFNRAADAFTLKPVIEATNVDYDWIQVQGLDSVRLSTVIIQHHDHIEMRKTNGDYFGEIVTRNHKGERLNIIKVVFKIKFSGQSNEREITLSKTRVSYIRNEDSFVLEEWLAIHGFAQYAIHELNANVCAA